MTYTSGDKNVTLEKTTCAESLHWNINVSAPPHVHFRCTSLYFLWRALQALQTKNCKEYAYSLYSTPSIKKDKEKKRYYVISDMPSLRNLCKAFYTLCSCMSYTLYKHFSYKLYVMYYLGIDVAGDRERNWIWLVFGRKEVSPGLKWIFVKSIGFVCSR